MQQGRIVDLIESAGLVGAVPEHPYTRMLVEASREYSRRPQALPTAETTA
jgi:ABC-type oligopeptide transport system ATPase subunit